MRKKILLLVALIFSSFLLLIPSCKADMLLPIFNEEGDINGICVSDTYILDTDTPPEWKGSRDRVKMGWFNDGGTWKESIACLRFKIRYPVGLKEVLNATLILRTEDWDNASLPFNVNVSLVSNNWDELTVNHTTIPEYLNMSKNHFLDGYAENFVDVTGIIRNNNDSIISLTLKPVEFVENLYGFWSREKENDINHPKLLIHYKIHPEPYPEVSPNNSKNIPYGAFHYISYTFNYRIEWECSMDPYYIDIVIWQLDSENFNAFRNQEWFDIWRLFDPFWHDLYYNYSYSHGSGSGEFPNGTYYLIFLNLDPDRESVLIDYNVSITLTEEPDPDPDPDPEPDIIQISSSNIIITLGIISVVSAFIIVFVTLKMKIQNSPRFNHGEA